MHFTYTLQRESSCVRTDGHMNGQAGLHTRTHTRVQTYGGVYIILPLEWGRAGAAS
jgi:hypothetical protein